MEKYSVHDLAYNTTIRNEDLQPVLVDNLEARILITALGIAIQGYFIIPVVRDGDDLKISEDFYWYGAASEEWLQVEGIWDEDTISLLYDYVRENFRLVRL